MTRRAAIDIGTNSTRLLIGGERGDMTRRTVVTGLGRGISRTGRVDPRGMARTLAVLESYREDLREAGVGRVRAVVTAVGRRATDVERFIGEASRVLGFAPQVISGDEEAALSYRGAVADLEGDEWTVVDIGGGSTEVIGAGSSVSRDIGSVTLTERYLGERPVQEGDLAEAREHAGAVLDLGPAPGGVVGVAGTWTSISAMSMGLDPYRPEAVHHSRVTAGAVQGWVERLSEMSVEETARLRGLDPARAPVILGGTIVAAAVLGALETGECLISEHDLLDGILAGLS